MARPTLRLSLTGLILFTYNLWESVIIKKGGDKMSQDFSHLLATFQLAANPSRALSMAAYMRNQFVFLGISQPERRKLCREFLNGSKKIPITELLALVKKLYEQEEREYHYLAIDLLRLNYRRLAYEDFRLFYQLIDQNAWWDSVDALRATMSLWLKENKQHLADAMTTLLAAESFWQRRVAITVQLLWKEETDTSWLEQAILKNMADQEFFIQKAIGWALRDYSKTNPDWVRAFLQEHQLSSLATREGSKYI